MPGIAFFPSILKKSAMGKGFRGFRLLNARQEFENNPAKMIKYCQFDSDFDGLKWTGGQLKRATFRRPSLTPGGQLESGHWHLHPVALRPV
jgi:hypothetical protein